MKFLFQGLVLALSSIIVGCSPALYSPSPQIIPLPSGKYESELIVSGSSMTNTVFAGLIDEIGLSLDAGAYYTLSNHELVLVNANVVAMEPFIQRLKDSSGIGRYANIELGYGYYSQIGESDFIFDLIGLAGCAYVSNEYTRSVSLHPDTDGEISAIPLSAFIQPVLGYKHPLGFMEASISVKTGAVYYSHIRGKLIKKDFIIEGIHHQQKILKDHRLQVMLEPAITLSTGSERTKFQFQIGANFNLTNARFPRKVFWTSLGMKTKLY